MTRDRTSALSSFLKEQFRKNKSLPICVVYGTPGPQFSIVPNEKRKTDELIEETIDKTDKDLLKDQLKVTFCPINEFKSTKISTGILKALGADHAIKDKQTVDSISAKIILDLFMLNLHTN